MQGFDFYSFNINTRWASIWASMSYREQQDYCNFYAKALHVKQSKAGATRRVVCHGKGKDTLSSTQNEDQVQLPTQFSVYSNKDNTFFLPFWTIQIQCKLWYIIYWAMKSCDYTPLWIWDSNIFMSHINIFICVANEVPFWVWNLATISSPPKIYTR